MSFCLNFRLRNFKPFKTYQAALTALEAAGPYSQSEPAVIRAGTKDSTEDVSTSIEFLSFQGSPFYVGNPAIGNLTLTSSSDSGIFITFNNFYVGDITTPNMPSASNLVIKLFAAFCSGAVTSTGGLQIIAPYNTGSAASDLTCADGASMVLVGLTGLLNDFQPPTVHAPNADVQIFSSLIADITSADSIELYDARLQANSSGVTPTYNDVFLNPALMDFSTLPTIEPTTVGAAWIDTTGGLNIVKVKL